MSALGDVVAALPHVELISAHHPWDEVWFLTSPGARVLVDEHPRLKIATLDRGRRFGEGGRWQVLRWVRKMGFERVYDLQGNGLSRKLVRASRAPTRIGTQPDPVYTRHAPEKWTRRIEQNAFTRLNDTLVAGGLPRAEAPGPVYLNGGDIGRVETWKKEQGLESAPYALLHAGGSRAWVSKRWPAGYFRELGRMIEERGVRVVWVGAGEDREVNAGFDGVGINATGVFTLRGLYALASGGLFAVCNDSCPMHLFAASGMRVFSLFGPTNWKWSHPHTQEARVLHRDVACSPCFKKRCPKARGHACLRGIHPESVMKVIAKDVPALKEPF